MNKPIDTVKVLSYKYLDGPNIWNFDKSIEVLVDIGEMENYPSNKIPNFSMNLKKKFPSMKTHECVVGEKGGFFERLDDGTYLGHILEHVTIELLLYSNYFRAHGKTRETNKKGTYKISFKCGNNFEVGKQCFLYSLEIIKLLINEKNFKLSDYMKKINKMSNAEYNDRFLNPIILSYPKRALPYFFIGDSLLQFGYGKNQFNIMNYSTNMTSGIADGIVGNILLYKNLLKNQGIPIVESNIIKSKKELDELSEDINFPIVIKEDEKTLDELYKISQYLNLSKKDDLFEYYRKLISADESSVIVENYFPLDSYKVLIVNFKFISCQKVNQIIKNIKLIGNGNYSIKELLEEYDAINYLENNIGYNNYESRSFEKPRYSDFNYLVNYLNSKNLKLDYVPKNNETIVINRRYKVPQDFTNYLNKDIIKKCELACKILDIDFCEVHLLLKNPNSGLVEGNGYILKINNKPDLYFYTNTLQKTNSVGKIIINHLSNNNNFHIPIIAITGDGKRSDINDILRKFLMNNNLYIGSTGENGFYLNDQKYEKYSKSRNNCVRDIFINKNSEQVIVDYNSNEIDNNGIIFSKCNAIILGDINENESNNLNEPEYSFKILRTIADCVPKDGVAVLNADDPNIEKLIEYIDGKIIFCSNYGMNKINPYVYKSVMNGGKIVLLQNDMISLCEGTITPFLKLEDNLDKEILIPFIAYVWSYLDLKNKNQETYLIKFIKNYFENNYKK